MKTWVIIVGIVVILTSCNAKRYEPKQYREYVTNPANGLVRTKLMGAIEYTVAYKPLSMIALVENNFETDTAKYNSVMSEIKGLQYFNLKMKVKNGKTADILQEGINGMNEYYGRVEYFSFGMQKDVFLIEDNDTLPCRLFQYERNYNTAPYSDFSLAFDDKGHKRSDKTLVIVDRVFNNGPVKVTIKGADINNIPALKI